MKLKIDVVPVPIWAPPEVEGCVEMIIRRPDGIGARLYSTKDHLLESDVILDAIERVVAADSKMIDDAIARFEAKKTSNVSN